MKNGPIISIIENKIQKFIDDIRPPVELRDKVDIGYEFEDNTVEIFEIRPKWDNEKEKTRFPIAKAKYIKSRNKWNVYWMRANGSWERYEPYSEVSELSIFFEILQTDKHGCFWG